jgi:putative hydrolase of the HAD superfamily
MSITHVFFDIGGVLGTNGWDRDQRAAAVAQFGLDAAEFADRHEEAVATWETGGMTMDDYLQCTVFHRPRAFSAEDFKTFMFAQSVAFPESIEVARGLARTRRHRLMTINNESAELNGHRLRHFGLRDIFVAFFSSCLVGALKPARHIYERALAMSQAEAGGSVFIDDRERNLDVPRMLGMHTILYRDAPRLRADLAALGVAF